MLTPEQAFKAAKTLDPSLVRITHDEYGDSYCYPIPHGLIATYPDTSQSYPRSTGIKWPAGVKQYPPPPVKWRHADPEKDRWGVKARFSDNPAGRNPWTEGTMVGYDPDTKDWISNTLTTWTYCQVIDEEKPE